MQVRAVVACLALVVACNGTRARMGGAHAAEAEAAPTPRSARATHGSTQLASVRAPSAAPTPAAEPANPPAEADLFAKFRAAARAVRAGETGRLVRIAHLGDSHTASEAMTGRLRELLQTELGDGGHGFVVPAWADARLHRGVILRDGGGWTVDRVRYTPGPAPGDRLFGIGAVGVRGSTSGTWAQVTGRGSVFDLYYLEAPGGGSFDVRVDDGPPQRVSTAASEIRAGFHRIDVENGRHVIDLRLVGDGEARLFGVEIEHPGPGIVYSSLGVTGARASTPLEWNEALFTAQLAHLSPDLVVVMYGTNDLFADDYTPEGYETALGTLLARAHAAVPSASCLVLAPPDVARRHGATLASVPEMPELVRRAREQAERAGCAFWDTFAKMGGAGSILTWGAARPPLAARDHVHLTRSGYEKLADGLEAEVLEPATR